ncbi:glycosyl hydrolases family 2, TIM barrel domain-containing protein [Pestalotiopsis sp. NC0098]|nr:glycosyl hydrolases family 2, TIM barrel domain-containing protein [Pestalotiopsis sp. NC0098]
MTSVQVHPAAQPDWNNLDVLHRNTLAPRANFYVYDSARDALSYDVTKSKTYRLSGDDWKFQHSKNPFEAPEGFESPSFDTAQWDDVAVPSMWQLNGYGKGPHYTNVNFPIPVDPPNVPFDDNETGSYVKKFTVPESLRGSQLRLRFEGVDSAFHVWINGNEIGYHQGSRNPSEFDITSAVDEGGENTLAVRVYQWSDATYIEDQDQWRMSGIYRNVYLLGFPAQARVEDLFVQTKLDKDYINADLKVRVDLSGSGQVKVELFDPAKNTVISHGTRAAFGGSNEFSFPVENPLKWTAETPTLYHLLVSLNDSTFVAHRIGFKQVEMKDGLIKVNGKRIVLKGANRHEHHPKFGRAVPYEFMKQDLLLMKRHNINAIRTSHQPSDVRLYDLADELGFWVMDEADLECHGFESIADAALSPEDRSLPFRERQLLTRQQAAQWTTDNPAWEKAYVDRAQQLVRRDQLHACVTFWSLGNEAFFGRNFKAMYDWIKSYDDSRPIHYEADIHAETMDMYSRMYPAIEEIVAFAEDESKSKPLVLCEFIHAMGNGPGNIKEYVDVFYKYPKLQGGFVWEWANHGLLTKDEETGDEYYAYGGDFGDEPNDGNFVMDGVLFSDHRPNPGLIEYKKAIEPIKVISYTATTVTIINRYDFVSLDHVVCRCFLNDDSNPVLRGTIELPSGLAPGQTAELSLPTAMAGKKLTDGLLTLVFRQREATLSLPQDFEIAFEQIPMTNTPVPAAVELGTQWANLEVAESPSLLTIKSEPAVWTFSPIEGKLRSFIKDGAEFLATSPEITFWRAPTDNDLGLGISDGKNWKENLLHLAKTYTRGSSWSASEDGKTFTVKVHQQFRPLVLSWSIDLEVTYVFSSSGTLAIHVKGVPGGLNLPRTLPRMGFSMELPPDWAGSDFEPDPVAVAWYGRGPGESYCDKKLSQRVGIYAVPRVSELWTEYEYPQEGGNRTDTRWVAFTNRADKRVTAQFVDLETSTDKKNRKLFDFNASHYRVKDVEAATHPYKLHKKRTENVVLRLDAAHHGLGSGSCGPKTRDEYALPNKEFEFELLLE